MLAGAVLIASLAADPARAQDSQTTPAPSWCVARGQAQPVCVYDDLLACSMNALATGGFCVKAEPHLMPAVTVEAAPPHQRKQVRRKVASKSHHDRQAQNDRLFREFVRWKETAPK